MSYLLVGIFLTVLAMTLLVTAIGVRVLEHQRRRAVSQMLEINRVETRPAPTRVLIERLDAEGRSFVRLLARFELAKKCQVLIQQAGLTWSIPQLLVTMSIAAVAGALVASRINVLVYPALSVVALAALFGSLPWFYVVHQRKKRLDKFESQFPESLDFIARALKAGHAFTVCLEMLSRESPEPLRGEFLKVYNEQNLGEQLPVVLRHLTARVPLLDVKFFVAAVLMQRDSGGNLGEILTKLAYVIRERFRLKGQVRAASAHGRITAAILTLLPLGTVIALTLIAPNYLPSMLSDPDGKYMIVGAILGQILGYMVMRRIINIRV